jgi:hypothetical protein
LNPSLPLQRLVVGSYLTQVHLQHELESNNYGVFLSDNGLYIKVKRMVYLSGRSDFKARRNNCAAQVNFGRYAEEHAKRQGKKPATFDFLGFTHICARSRRGKFIVQVRTMKKRLRRGLTAIAEWCQENRHKPVDEQQNKAGEEASFSSPGDAPPACQ